MKKLIITTLLFFAAFTLNAGVIYEAKIETEIYNQPQYENQEENPMGDMVQQMTKPYTIKAMLETENRGRVKFTSDGPLMFAKGTFIISESKDTVYLCNPQDKSYSKLNIGNANKQLGGFAAKLQKMTKMKYKNISVNIAELGDGGDVAGYSTKKYKLVVEYDTEMKILFKKVKDHQKKEYIIYATKKLPFEMMGEYSNKQFFTTAIENIDSQIQSKVGDIGFPLKIENLAYDKENKLVSKMSFTITSVKEKDLNPKLFTIPAGYTEKEMEVQTEGEDGTKQKQKIKLGDLFKWV